jgi:hypothetical protein
MLLSRILFGMRFPSIRWLWPAHCSLSNLIIFNNVMLIWSPVTRLWRVLRLRMEETASRYGRQLRMYWISSRGQPTRDRLQI